MSDWRGFDSCGFKMPLGTERITLDGVATPQSRGLNSLTRPAVSKVRNMYHGSPPRSTVCTARFAFGITCPRRIRQRRTRVLLPGTQQTHSGNCLKIPEETQGQKARVVAACVNEGVKRRERQERREERFRLRRGVLLKSSHTSLAVYKSSTSVPTALDFS